MNKIIVIGHLGRDPEMRYTPNGQICTSLTNASGSISVEGLSHDTTARTP